MVKMAKKKNVFRSIGISTAKTGTIFLATEVISTFFSVLVIIFLANTSNMSVPNYGIFIIGIALLSLIPVGLGIGTAFRKKLPEILNKKNEIKKLLTNGYLAGGAIVLIIAIAVALLSGYLSFNVYKVGSSLVLPLQIIAVCIIFSIFYNLSNAALVGLGRINIASISNLLYGITRFFFIAVFVLSGFGIIGALSGYLLSLVIPTVFEMVFLLKYIDLGFIDRKLETVKELMRFSNPVLVANLSNIGMNNFLIIFLGAFVSSQVIGSFGTAFNFSGFITIMTASFTFILIPAFSLILSKKAILSKIKKAFESSIYYSYLLIFPILIYAISIAKPVFDLLISSTYTNASFYFSVMIIGATISVIGIYAGSLIVSFGKTKKYMKYQLIVTGIELILIILFVPIFKANGALFSMFILAPVLSNLIYIYGLRKEFSISPDLSKPFRVFIAALVLGILLFYLSLILSSKAAIIIINLILLIALYPPLLGIFGGVDKKDLKFVRDFGERFPVLNRGLSLVVRYAEMFTKI